MKKILLFVLLLTPIVYANHADIPYYTYNGESRPFYYYGTASGTDTSYVSPQYARRYTPYYDAGYRKGNLYERYGYTTDYEIRGKDNGNYYGSSEINDRYRTSESYERTVEYNYDNYGKYYNLYDPRYDGRKSRTLMTDYNDGYYTSHYRPSLYSSGRIAIEDEYGPVHYNYRGQRYGYDAEGRRFYY